ncbi:hypothetical protein [Vibrio bivalvicida]|uniref:Uncharacterized protein n=1 Tax=Vibrio bivalvicida TaxID=1276888 RepID=A0A177XV83_9VIBR|nr:hypothetical protein [Vibrio bivalvicida]OAJ92429.1 hypothetical protein APB76_20765 [Vibrio bivalvicida]
MNINKTNAVENQVKSAESRSRNAKRRNEIKALVKAMSISELLGSNGFNIGELTIQAKQEILVSLYPELMKVQYQETLKHKHKVEQMLVQSELGELKQSANSDDEYYTLEELGSEEFLSEITVQGLADAYEAGREVINEDELKALIDLWNQYNEQESKSSY